MLSGQLFVGWTNDYIDRSLDKAAIRKDKPLATGEVSEGAVRRAYTVATGVCVAFTIVFGPIASICHFTAIGAATAYNLKLKRSVFSVVPYAVAFGLLPAFVTFGLGRTPPLWAVAAGALLGAGAHFTQALPDIETDRAAGVLGLPQRLGATGSVIASAVLFATAFAFLLGVIEAAAVLIAILLVGLTKPKLAFPVTVTAAALAVAVLLLRGVKP